MALPLEIKEQFEKRVGARISELAEMIDEQRNIPKHFTPSIKSPRHEFGRGYVHFGRAVSSKQKDKENLEILSNW